MKKEEIEIFKKLFEAGKWEEAQRFSEKLPKETILSEFQSIILFNTNQKKQGEDLSSELIKNYIKKHQFFDCLSFMELMRVFCKKNYKNYFKIQNRIFIQAKFWSGLLDVIRDIFLTYSSDIESVSQYVESLSSFIGNKDALKMIEDINTIVKTKKIIDNDSAKLAQEGIDFAVPKYLEKIGSNENAAYSYIKIAKKAIELGRTEEAKSSIEALERLGYGGLLEVKELKKNIESKKDNYPYGIGRKNIAETVVNFIDGAYERIPIEAPENHTKYAQSLFQRALYEQAKYEYLFSVLAYPPQQRKTYIENLFSDLSNQNIDWANEVVDFFLNSGKVNKDDIDSLKITRLSSIEQEVADLTKEIMKTMGKADFFSKNKANNETKGTLGIYTKEESLISQPLIKKPEENKISENFKEKFYKDIDVPKNKIEESTNNIETDEIEENIFIKYNESQEKAETIKDEEMDKKVHEKGSNEVKETINENKFSDFTFKESSITKETPQEEGSEGNIDFL